MASARTGVTSPDRPPLIVPPLLSMVRPLPLMPTPPAPPAPSSKPPIPPAPPIIVPPPLLLIILLPLLPTPVVPAPPPAPPPAPRSLHPTNPPTPTVLAHPTFMEVNYLTPHRVAHVCIRRLRYR